MKLMSITSRSILKEMLPPFCINVLVFSFLFIMTKMIGITNWIVNYNLNVWSVLALIAYILGLFFFLLYYLMLTAGYAFGENGAYPPAVGMRLPNMVMTGLGLCFLLQTARERNLMIELLVQRIQKFFARFACPN